MSDTKTQRLEELFSKATQDYFVGHWGPAAVALEEITKLGDSDDAVAKDPRFIAAHRNLGLIYADTYRHQLAIEPLRKAIRLGDTDDAGVYRALEASLFIEGRYDESIEPMERALQLDEQDPVVWFFLAIARMEMYERTSDPRYQIKAREAHRTLKSRYPRWAKHLARYNNDLSD